MPEITFLEAAELVGTEKQKEYARNNKWFNGGSYQSFIERIACYYTNPRKGTGRLNKTIIFDEEIPKDIADKNFQALVNKKQQHLFNKPSGRKYIGGFEGKGLKNGVVSLLHKTVSSLIEGLDIGLEDKFILGEESVGMTKTQWMLSLNLKNEVITKASRNIKEAKRLHGLMSLEDGLDNINQEIIIHALYNEDKYASERFSSILKTLTSEEKVTKEIVTYAMFECGDYRELTPSESILADEVTLECLRMVNTRYGKTFKMETVMANYSTCHFISNVQKEFKKTLCDMLLNKLGIKYTNELIFISLPTVGESNIDIKTLRRKVKNEVIKERTKRAVSRESKLNKKETEIYEARKERMDFSKEEQTRLAIAKMKVNKEYAMTYELVLNYIWSNKSTECLTELTDTTEFIKDNRIISKAKIEENAKISSENHKLILLEEAQHEADCNYVFGDLVYEDATFGDDYSEYENYVARANECGKKIYVVTSNSKDLFEANVEYRLERSITTKRTRKVIPVLQDELSKLKEENKKTSDSASLVKLSSSIELF